MRAFAARKWRNSVDALALGASGATRESSSLSFRTTSKEAFGNRTREPVIEIENIPVECCHEGNAVRGGGPHVVSFHSPG